MIEEEQNCIQAELEIANKYRHELELDKDIFNENIKDKNFKLLKLTRNNVARVEAMISTDSSYQSENNIDIKFKILYEILKEYEDITITNINDIEPNNVIEKIEKDFGKDYFGENEEEQNKQKNKIRTNYSNNITFKPIVITFDGQKNNDCININITEINGTKEKKDKIKKENNKLVREALKNHLIYQIVSDIDNANSTHLNSDRIGRIRLTNRILNFTINDFFDNLKKTKKYIDEKYFNPEQKKKSLYYELAKNTREENEDNLSVYSYNGKRNASFASKFLQSACFHMFTDENQDNYSKYDNIVKKVLPYYAKRYGVDRGKIDCSDSIDNYKNFYDAIGDIITNAKKVNNERISRNGFDHLLWYYYKGDLDEIIDVKVDEIDTKEEFKNKDNK